MSNKIVSMQVRYARERAVVSRLLAVALLIACCAVSRVAAQTPSTESVLLLSPAHVENAALRADIARGLRSAGLVALQVADLGLDPVLAACRQPACAAEAAGAAGKAALLVQALGAPRGDAVLIELHWQDPSGVAFRERSSTTRDKLGSAVGALAQRVVQRRVLGEQALLRVDSTPLGAAVHVDGRLAGLTPFEQAWEAGAHEVRVEQPGFETQSARVRLAPGDLHQLRLALRRRTAAHTGLPAAERASPLNFVVGGVLAVAALPLLIGGANPALNDGQCVASGPVSCETAHFGAREAVLLGAGALALGGAAVFFIAQPLRLQLEAAPSAGGLRIRGAF